MADESEISALVESIKKDPDSFGGFHTRNLQPEEISLRMCCALGCRSDAEMEIQLFPQLLPFRVVCKVHGVKLALLYCRQLGMPSPDGFARNMAATYGIPWSIIESSYRERVVSHPQDWSCVRCGGAMDPGPGGVEWHHTCNPSKDGDNDLRQGN